jgi:tRNA (guanine37-N1)-methyltransferase
MVLKAEPLFRALDAVAAGGATVVLTSPQGTTLTQDVAVRLSQANQLVLLCGRYEGVDERVRSRVDEEISIGDYVLSGGELPALVIVDTVARLIPGVVGDEQSVVGESFTRGLLDYPQYTRPATLPQGAAADPAADRDAALDVPPVLLSGNHGEIRRWRKREAVRRTLNRRPDLLEHAQLDDEELQWLRELVAQREKE